MVSFFFLDEVPFDAAAFKKSIVDDPDGRRVLNLAVEVFATVEWNAVALHEATQQLGESIGLNLRKSQAPIRCAVTGTSVGPPLFESMELLGREAVLERLRGALVRADA
jgi:glutamyl-tRNA synthetase